MDAVLAYILSFWGIIEKIVSFYMEHPVAGTFFITLASDAVLTWIPLGGKTNGAMAIVGNAIIKAFERKGVTLKSFAILALCLGLCACATMSAIKSDATPKETAQAVCSDLQTTITAASAIVAWTTIYFPNQQKLLTEVTEYLSLAEESRSAACSAVDLVVDTDSLASLITTKQSAVLSLVGKINSLVAKIKGASTSSVEREYDQYRLEGLACLDPRLPGINGPLVALSAKNGWNGANAGI